MNTNATKEMIALAKGDHVAKSFRALVAKSVEVGVVVPSILQKHLQEAGYTVETEKLTNGARCTVSAPVSLLQEVGSHHAKDWLACETRDPNNKPDLTKMLIVARGQSNDAGDALLHAVLAEMRTEAKNG